MKRLLVIVFVAGCNQIVGIEEPRERDTSVSPTTPDIGAFTGRWSVTSGSSMIDCTAVGGSSRTTDDVGSTIDVAVGATSDLVFGIVGSGCGLEANVRGSVASIVTGQSCTVRPPNETDTFAFETGTFTLNADGTASVKLTGTVTVVPPSASCTFEETDTLAKTAD